MSNRAKTLKYASDDQADTLLAELLESTAELAQAEQSEFDAEILAKRIAKEEAAAAANAERLASRQAKLQIELERQEELARRRTMRMKALTPTPAAEPEAAAIDEPAAMIDEAEMRRQIAAEVREELREFAVTPIPAAPVRSRRSRPGLMLAAAAVMLAGGLGAAALVVNGQYQPDPNPYAKAVFAPMDRNAVALEVASTPIPKAVPIVAEKPEPAARPVRPAVRSKPEKVDKPKSVFGKPNGKTDAASSYDRLKGLLDSSSDPFTMD